MAFEAASFGTRSLVDVAMIGDAQAMLSGDARKLSNGHVSIAKINDPMDLADKITQILGLSKIERRILGQESWSHVSKEYSMDRMVSRYGSLFEQLN